MNHAKSHTCFSSPVRAVGLKTLHFNGLIYICSAYTNHTHPPTPTTRTRRAPKRGSMWAIIVTRWIPSKRARIIVIHVCGSSPRASRAVAVLSRYYRGLRKSINMKLTTYLRCAREHVCEERRWRGERERIQITMTTNNVAKNVSHHAAGGHKHCTTMCMVGCGGLRWGGSRAHANNLRSATK